MELIWLPLGAICEHPSFDYEGSVEQLRDAFGAFAGWLEQEVNVDIWLPSINKKAAITVPRVNFLKICGNISKHNFLRLGMVVDELRKTFVRSGIAADINDTMTVLAEVYERFHDDIFNGHVSTIAEFLNNILGYLLLLAASQAPPKHRLGRGSKIHQFDDTVTPTTVVRTYLLRSVTGISLNEVSREPYFRRDFR